MNFETKIEQILQLLQKNTDNISEIKIHESRVLELIFNSGICLEQLEKLHESSFLQIHLISEQNLRKQLLSNYRTFTKNIYRWIQRFSFNKSQEISKNAFGPRQAKYRCQNCENHLETLKIRSIKDQIMGRERNSLKYRIEHPNDQNEEQEDEFLTYRDNFWQNIKRSQFQQNNNSLYPKAQSYITHALEQERLKQDKNDRQISKMQAFTQTQKRQDDNFEKAIDELLQKFLLSLEKQFGKKSLREKIINICKVLQRAAHPVEKKQNSSNSKEKINECLEKEERIIEKKSYKIIPKPKQIKEKELVYGKREQIFIQPQQKSKRRMGIREPALSKSKRNKLAEQLNESLSTPAVSIEKIYISPENSVKENTRREKKDLKISRKLTIANKQNEGEAKNKTMTRNRTKIKKITRKRTGVLEKQGNEENKEEQLAKKQYKDQGVQCQISSKRQGYLKDEIIPIKSSKQEKDKREIIKNQDKITNQAEGSKKLSESLTKNKKLSKNHKNRESHLTINPKKTEHYYAQILNDTKEKQRDSSLRLETIKSRHEKNSFKGSSRKSIIQKRDIQEQENDGQREIKYNNGRYSLKKIESRNSLYKTENKLKKKEQSDWNIERKKYIKNLIKTSNSEHNSLKKVAQYSFNNLNPMMKDMSIDQKIQNIKCLRQSVRQEEKRGVTKTQNLFFLEDLELFGGLNEAYIFQNRSENQQILLEKIPNTGNQSSLKTNCQAIVNHIKNLSNFKTPLYESVMCFLFEPYSCVSQNQVSRRKWKDDNENEILEKIVFYLIGMHKKECDQNLCNHISRFLRKIQF